MIKENPALIQGIYSQPYNEIVRPGQIWTITKYFLRRWTPYLGASQAWLIIGARQLSYFNQNQPWFLAYDATLAEAAGLHVKVFRRTIKKEITAGEGAVATFLGKVADPVYRRKQGVTRQSQTRYQIRLDDPLTPADADALAFWLRRHCPQRVTAGAIALLLEEALAEPAAGLQAASSEPQAAETAGLYTVADVVAHVFPAVADSNSWREAADALHTHIVSPELAHVETQYLRRHWLPLLGPGPALLLTYLRSLCFHNEESGELRDQIVLESGQLETVFQVSARTLRRWFGKLEEAAAGDNLLGPFYRVLETVKQSNQKVATRYWVNMRTPLTPDDLVAYRKQVAGVGPEPGPAGASGGTETSGKGSPGELPDKKFPTQSEGAGQKVPDAFEGHGQEVPHTTEGEGQKVVHTPQPGGQKVPHTTGGGGQKVGGWRTKEGCYKYYSTLADALQLPSLKALLAKIPEQQQHHWHIEDGRARDPFAVVVVDNSLEQLLAALNIQEPARQQILVQRLPLAQAMAWHLYTEQVQGLTNPAGYLVQRLRQADPPPEPFLAAARLSWEQWRSYAAAVQLHLLLPPNALAPIFTDPGFATWRDLYGRQAPERLPFGVGEGVEILSGLVAEGEERPSGPAPERAAAPTEAQRYWQETLRELQLQMSRSTFDAWLGESRLVGQEGERLLVGVPDEATAGWLSNRLQATIERTLAAVGEGPTGVRFVVLPPNDS